MACALPLLCSGPAGTPDSSAPSPGLAVPCPADGSEDVVREQAGCASGAAPGVCSPYSPKGHRGPHGGAPGVTRPASSGPRPQGATSCPELRVLPAPTLRTQAGAGPRGEGHPASVLSASCPLSYRDRSWEVITDCKADLLWACPRPSFLRGPFTCFPHRFPWTKPLVLRPFLTFPWVISSRERSPRGEFHQ